MPMLMACAVDLGQKTPRMIPWTKWAPLIHHLLLDQLPSDNHPEPEQHPRRWCSAHLRIEQSKDKHLNEVLQWLEEERRPCKEEMKGANRHMWPLWSQYNQLLLQYGLLYRRWFDEKTEHESLQLCVPHHLKGDVLWKFNYQCVGLQTMCGNAFTGLAIPQILNCTFTPDRD